MPAKHIYIESADQLDSILSGSSDCPIVLLKHSVTCGISAHILYQLSAEIDCDIHIIVVQTHRLLSNMVAELMGHRHQSPQMFVIADGKAIHHATHYGINGRDIIKWIPLKAADGAAANAAI